MQIICYFDDLECDPDKTRSISCTSTASSSVSILKIVPIRDHCWCLTRQTNFTESWLSFLSKLIFFTFLANVNSHSRSLYVVVRSSICRLSVTFVHSTQAIEIFGNVSTPSLTFPKNFYGDRPRGTPPTGEWNTRGVAEYSDFGHIERYGNRARYELSLY